MFVSDTCIYMFVSDTCVQPQPKVQHKAFKNAADLQRRHRYELSAAFHLICDPPRLHSALVVICKHMQDYALAIAIGRVVEPASGSALVGPVTRDMLTNYVLPAFAGDQGLVAVVRHWIGECKAGRRAVSEPSGRKIWDDSEAGKCTLKLVRRIRQSLSSVDAASAIVKTAAEAPASVSRLKPWTADLGPVPLQPVWGVHACVSAYVTHRLRELLRDAAPTGKASKQRAATAAVRTANRPAAKKTTLSLFSPSLRT